jgi:ELWxxDGT repeat protein
MARPTPARSSFARSWFLRNAGRRCPTSGSARRRRQQQVGVERLEQRRVLSATPQLVRDLNPSGDAFALQYLDVTAVGSTLFFTATDGSSGRELWKTDGTLAGTVLVKDISPANGDSNPYALTAIGSTLYFMADDGTNGYELWKSDGTAAGTVLVKDINPGSGSSFPAAFTAVGGTVYFTASDGTNGRELWKTNGTAGGTVLVKDINTATGPGYYSGEFGSSFPSSLTAVGGTLYFTADDGEHGEELWKTDGTAGGTVLVKDINTGSYLSYGNGTYGSNPEDLTAVAGTLYFSADDGESGAELWKTNGTAAGTVLVKDIQPGSGGSALTYLTAVGSTLYFSARNGAAGVELWKSDGTAGGTVLVKQVAADATAITSTSLAMVGGTVYFTAATLQGQQLWKSDGTTGGTVLVKEFAFAPNPPPNPVPLNTAAVGGVLYFTANDGTSGSELWKSDGTAGGTVLVQDIRSGSDGSYPYGITAVGNTLYFTADDGQKGRELWRLTESVAPVKPSAPTAVKGQPGNREVTLSWAAPIDDGGSAVTDYFVQYSANDGASWQRFLDGVSTNAFARVTGLTNGISYRFRVAAVNAAGVGTYSLRSQPVTPRQTAPSAPGDIQVTPGNGRVTLSWTAPANNGGSVVTDYFVQYSSNDGATWTRFLDGIRPTPNAVVVGLANGTSYRFRVAAINSIGLGAYSAPSAAVKPKPTVPGAPSVPGATAGNWEVLLNWSAPASNGGATITDYFVQYSSDNGLTWIRFADGISPSPTAKMFATNGTSYRFRVAAVNAVGRGPFSAASAAVTPQTPV